MVCNQMGQRGSRVDVIKTVRLQLSYQHNNILKIRAGAILVQIFDESRQNTDEYRTHQILELHNPW